jgi:hypothetical protein
VGSLGTRATFVYYIISRCFECPEERNFITRSFMQKQANRKWFNLEKDWSVLGI